MSRDTITPQHIERARQNWAPTIPRRTEQRDIARHVHQLFTDP
jgi:hypothetical protein